MVVRNSFRSVVATLLSVLNTNDMLQLVDDKRSSTHAGLTTRSTVCFYVHLRTRL